MQPDEPFVFSILKLRRCGRVWLGTALAGAIALTTLGCSRTPSSPAVLPAQTAAEQTVAPTSELTYQAYDLENATVHVVTLPATANLSIAVADELISVADFARQEEAIALLNAGFFDPQNSKTTSYLIEQGQLVGDPAENERLVGNPNLAPYMDKILNRSEFRVYECGVGVYRYDITRRDAPVPMGCAIESAVGAGPQLLPAETSFEEGFTDFENGERVRDAIGSSGPNARSAIALTADGTILLIMVAQRPDALGFALTEVADFAASLGAVKLLNLDGGSSSSLHYNGQTYLGRLDAEGNSIERPVKSVLVVRP